MSNRSGFSLNITEMDKRMLLFSGKVDKITKLAMFEAAAALKLDADNISPKTPHLHGNLKGDAKRSAKAKATKTGNEIRPEWFPKIEKEDLGKNKLSVLVTYCAPYAARWHEAVDERINWSEDGVGPKFLEAKMARQDLRDKYYGLIAERIKQELAS
jgi:hypothetical protein